MLTLEKRNQLILNHMSNAEKIAFKQFKKTPKCVQLDELKSAAYMGLIQAADKYKDDKPFEPYASFRIYGEIKDYLRSLSWGSRRNSVKVVSYEEEQPDKSESYYDDFFENLTKDISDIGRKILFMYYVEELTMKEIGLKLELSATRIYQIIQKNLIVLKESYAKSRVD